MEKQTAETGLVKAETRPQSEAVSREAAGRAVERPRGRARRRAFGRWTIRLGVLLVLALAVALLRVARIAWV